MAVPKSTTTLAQISTVLLHQLNLKSRLVARNFLSQLALFLLARRLSFLLTKAGRFILRNKKDNRRAWMAFLLFFCGIDSCFSIGNMVLPNQFHTEYHRVTLSHTKTPIPWGFLVVESPKTA